MDKNNAFMELQSNFKRAHIETDLTNLHVNPCSRKKKKKKI
jgi:aryl carrier-like protein